MMIFLHIFLAIFFFLFFFFWSFIDWSEYSHNLLCVKEITPADWQIQGFRFFNIQAHWREGVYHESGDFFQIFRRNHNQQPTRNQWESDAATKIWPHMLGGKLFGRVFRDNWAQRKDRVWCMMLPSPKGLWEMKKSSDVSKFFGMRIWKATTCIGAMSFFMSVFQHQEVGIACFACFDRPGRGWRCFSTQKQMNMFQVAAGDVQGRKVSEENDWMMFYWKWRCFIEIFFCVMDRFVAMVLKERESSWLD